MPLDPFQELLLSELSDLKRDVKDVRTQDIPALQRDIAGFHGNLKTLKDQQKWSTRFYTIIGGVIAVAIARFTGHN